MIGTVVAGRYRVDATLGKGGSGMVFRAEDLSLGRPVALKVVHPVLAAIGDVIERFRREARVLARLRHENAVHVYDFGSDPKITYIAMELVEGQSLAQVLAHERRLPFARAVSIAAQALAVLEVAHQLGVVHRDLKPTNLLLEDRAGKDHVRVVDFGIALLLGDQAPRLTGEGRVFGTPTYMAPEQCLGKPVDARTDLYAVGCTLYEMLVGRPPFEDPSGTAVMMAHVHRAPVPPRKLAPAAGIPPALEGLVLRALAKLPAQRFADAKSMREALLAALDPAAPSPPPRRGLAARPPRVASAEDSIELDTIDGGAPIALLEDTRGVGVGTALGAMGLAVTPITDGEDVAGFALVIVAEGDAAGLAAAARFARESAAPVLLCGPDDDLALMARAIEAGVHDYIALPLDPTDLAKKVSRALRGRR